MTPPSSTDAADDDKEQPKARPNVIFILTDDQGYGELGYTGNKYIRTPHLDELARSPHTVQFTDHHSGTTCAPTRSGLLTGHYANSTGVWHTIGGHSLLREDEFTLPQALGGVGYATAHCGKWHLGDATPLRPFERGFDLSIYHGGGGVGNTPDAWGNDYFDDTYFVNGEPTKFQGYCTDVWFSQTIQFIKSHEERKAKGEKSDDNKPFFVYLATNAPHHPFNVENKYADLYRGIAPTEDQARFYGMVTNIDENVGRLRSELDEMGLADNTILIFMSDNGSGGGVSQLDKDGHVTEGPGNYNAGMRGMKGWEYEGGHRVPLLIHCPPTVLGPRNISGPEDIQGGQICNELTAYVDIMPTVLDLTNTPMPEGRHFHGVSLGPIVRGYEQPELHDRAIVTDTQRVARPVKWFHSSVMKNKWRLINGMELYNIEDDPGQRTDVRADHPDLVAELRGEYDKWWDIVSDQFGRDVPYVLGRIEKEVVELSAHDIRNEASDVPWLQEHVREAKVVSGYWALKVETAGTYTVELRRWPKSTNYTLTQGIDGDDSGWRKDCIQEKNAGMYEGGVALPLRWAHVEVQGVSVHTEVDPDAASVFFSVQLSVGETQLFAAFYDKGPPRVIAPYYVYIKKMA